MDNTPMKQDDASGAGGACRSEKEIESSSVPKATRLESRRWWLRLLIQPALFLLAGALLLTGLGVAQKLGWISSGGASGHLHITSVSGSDVSYICPMMCTPPQAEPGRCPVCAMELVPAAATNSNSDARSIQIDANARRIANIQTMAVRAAPLTRRIRAIGELSYDEGTLKTLSAYVDGRLDRLFADYTGVRVQEGDHLALLYSPLLYSAQVELLETGKSLEEQSSATLSRVVESQKRLYESARQRLIELCMTESQVVELERAGQANSRLVLCSPISGTVIEKLAVEGQYVKEGQAIYRLADLSTVWLMLELFPEDAASIRYGHKVEAEVQSLPGRSFTGRVAFIDPNVDPETRTVGVRVVISNDKELLRVGDYARAMIEVPVVGSEDDAGEIYDPELADKWISPRHPHVIEDSPGKCRLCGVALVPAAQFGFVDAPARTAEALAVPRSAVLMAGGNSVVYVETEPGRFELRRVVLGPSCDEQIAVLSGLQEGEYVATEGNFLIDSQMQLAGNPSLIDPTKATPDNDLKDDRSEAEVLVAALASLTEEDRALAVQQKICPVTEMALGSMGPPLRVDVNGQSILVCCAGCESRLRAEPEKYLANLAASSPMQNDGPELPEMQLPEMDLPEMAAPRMAMVPSSQASSDPIEKALAGLSRVDKELAQRQKTCPVADMPLGSMGVPVKVDVNGRAVFICCEGCRESLLSEPAKYLAKLSEEVSR